MRRHRLCRVFLIGLTFFIGGVDKSLAEAWILTPSLGLEASYDDNYLLSTTEPAKVGTGRVIGALELSRRTEALDVSGLVQADATNYFGEDDKTLGSSKLDNKSNQLLALEAARALERTQYGLETSFRRDSLHRTASIVDDSSDSSIVGDSEDVTIEPNDDIDDNLAPAQVDIRRNRLILTPKWESNLSELSKLQLTYRYNNVSFEEDSEGVSVFDFSDHTVTADFRTSLTEKDRLVVRPRALLYESDSGNEYETYELQTGVSREFSETTAGQFTLGARHTSFNTTNMEGNNTGFVAQIRGTKRTGLTTFSGLVERTVSPSGSGDQVRTDQIVLNLSRLLSERLRFTLRSRIYENEAIQDTASRSNRRYLAVEPRLSYTLSSDWTLEGAYRYRRQKRFFETGSSDSNAIIITLIYSLSDITGS